MRSCNLIYICAISVILAGCGTKPIQPSDKHIQRQSDQAAATTGIPETVKRGVVLPPPKPATKVETYSVVVTNVPAQEILFALARDAKINLDIHPGIQGTVTVNAINQTLPQILTRIAKQVDMRYELNNGYLTVMPDKPFLKTYKIDFINMSRSATSTNSTSGQITGGVTGSAGASGSGGGSGGNSASTSITSETKNNLMDNLVQNVKDIILDEDKLHYQEQEDLQTQQRIQARGTGTTSGSISLASPTNNNGIEINQAANGGQVKSGSRTGSSASGSGNQDVQGQGGAVAKKGIYERAVNVFANKETGVLIVRASSLQHEKIQEFIDMVMSAAKRQVLIEATIVEVQLSNEYHQGIDWSRALLGAPGFTLGQAAANIITKATPGVLNVNYLNTTSRIGNINATVKLLEKFGNVKVLSSPKLTVMNNQTASLKVDNSKVYFTVKADIIPATLTSPASASYSTIANSVSVGLTMTVTPQISDTDTVTINVRPSISSLIGLGVQDPNPILANPCGFGVTGCTIAAIENRVPEIQTREMESILKIENGQTAVMGGLIKEEINLNTSEIPLLGRIPIFGNLFQNRDDTTTKTELVIFLRPVVIKDASINGDFSAFRSNLPDQDFFKESASGKP